VNRKPNTRRDAKRGGGGPPPAPPPTKPKASGRQENLFHKKALPAWELHAKQSITGLRRWVERNDDIGFAIFHTDFLNILHAFVSQLINWAEQEKRQKLRDWAGVALADLLQFLAAQQRDWSNDNNAFAQRYSDKRKARPPRSYLGWKAGDYLRRLTKERLVAGVLLLPASPRGVPFAQLAHYSDQRIKRLEMLRALPDFNSQSAPQWAEAVFQEMKRNKTSILNDPAIRGSKSYESSQRRADGKLRLDDYKRTIRDAIVRLSKKPPGLIRGITRPF
jgi:hypothetical protein